MRTEPFTGLILAGGRSRRMGTDKAFLPIDGEPLISRVATVISAAGAQQILVIGGDRGRLEQLGFEVRCDRNPGEGPLDGLVTGLRAMSTEWAFVTACDHPSLDADLPGLLLDRALESDVDACVPLVAGVSQVLAAIYRARVADILDAAYSRGERSVRRAIKAAEITELDDVEPRWFVDLDDVADVEAFEEGMSEGPLRE